MPAVGLPSVPRAVGPSPWSGGDGPQESRPGEPLPPNPSITVRLVSRFRVSWGFDHEFPHDVHPVGNGVSRSGRPGHLCADLRGRGDQSAGGGVSAAAVQVGEHHRGKSDRPGNRIPGPDARTAHVCPRGEERLEDDRPERRPRRRRHHRGHCQRPAQRQDGQDRRHQAEPGDARTGNPGREDLHQGRHALRDDRPGRCAHRRGPIGRLCHHHRPAGQGPGDSPE